MKYGKELMIQVPVGRGQTRQFTMQQAAVAYKHLHGMRKLLVSVPMPRCRRSKGKKHD